MTRSELHAHPEYRRQVEALHELGRLTELRDAEAQWRRVRQMGDAGSAPLSELCAAHKRVQDAKAAIGVANYANMIQRQRREEEGMRNNPYAMYDLALNASQEWMRRVETADTDAAINKFIRSTVARQIMSGMHQDYMRRAIAEPAPKPRRAITNAQLPRLNRHYRWTA